MKLSIDGKEVDYDVAGNLSLKEVLEKTSEEIHRAQRIVIGLEVNGGPFKGDEQELAATSVGETRDLNIVTSPILDIIVNSLNAANLHLPQMIGGIEKCALLLDNGQIIEGMELLQQVVAGLGGFIEIIDKSTQVIGTALAPSLVEELPIIERRVAINESLNKVVEYLNKGEFEVVSKTLNDELAEVLREWIVFLPKVIDRIKIGLN